ncbi:MAG: 2-hydroxyacyl-CoA dehydratase [Chloroflexi bacterium]|nr:2-hydroxyacyl-CoA dehydratase [Chloroflexota bacterium]MBI3733623.1 2-hydroxyacyl-CoA dehydratase [Chloroflexota bacterium]
MTTNTPTQDLVGRAARDGGTLFRQWFERLSGAPERGEQSAYVFVMGSMAEILRVFDLHTVFPEINSLQTAVRRVAHEYLNVAEDYGYSPDICGYVKADVGMQLRDGHHPMGRVPKPNLAVLTNACNTYIKWSEIWERFYHIPVFTLDVPGSRSAADQTKPGDADFERDRRYVEYQIGELIALCEQVSGKRFDIDRLREVLGYTNLMSRAWRKVFEFNKHRPAPFNAITEGTIYLGVANALRGTPEGARYFEELVEEMAYKTANHIGTLHDEKYRLIFVGVPCYPIFRRFYELFAEWGGNFVNSSYLWFAAGGMDLGFEYDLTRPIESLAEGVLVSVRHAMDSMMFQHQALIDLIDPFHVDGIVYHPIKSCRTVSTGLADNRRAVMAARDVACLYIESDMMDKRVVSEAQMKNRIDAFFEGLATRKLHSA